MLEWEHNAQCYAFQKDPEKGYHRNDPRRHLYAHSQNELVCVTRFRVNNQGIGADSLFINSDLRSIYYITKIIYCICLLY